MNAWQEILGYLKNKVNTQSFQTWLRPTRFSHVAEGNIYVRVPNREFEDWIEEKYGTLITAALAELRMKYSRVSYLADDASTAGHGHAPAARPVQGKLDFDASCPQLDARLTFDAFVVGSCNQFAHAAARAVAQSPSKAYNPLFLYGGVGLGKTHLMNAIGHSIKSQWKEMRLAYLSAEMFTNEVINSLRFDRMISLRDRYRNVDVLMVDDIEFIAGKERTQEEFFHTFNALYQSQKQVVISCDSAPKDIPALEDRLKSRFSWGLTADLQPPDLETKMAILVKKAEAQGHSLPRDVSEFIASRIKASIRDLEGALNRLLAYASMTGDPVDVGMAQHVLKELLDEDVRRVSLETIQRAVCREFSLSLGQLKSHNNSQKIAYPRQLAMYLAKQLTPTSLPQIGKEFGGKHHTTVLHSIRKIEELRRDDKELNRIINRLTDSLR